MKIDCGVPSWNRPPTEKDRCNVDKWREQGRVWLSKRAHKMKWHRWYAWFPVRLANNDCRWLEWVERRIQYYEGVAPMEMQRFYIELTPEAVSGRASEHAK